MSYIWTVRAADLFKLHNLKTITSEALSKNRPHPVFAGPRTKRRITVEVCGLQAAQILSVRRFVTL